MKIRYLFSDFRPLLKCGAEAALPILGQVGSTIYQQESANANVNKQLNAQSEENQKNRDWQTEQAEIARQWQAGQTQQQNQFQTELAAQQQKYNLQSMEQQSRLNSPVHQRQQLEAAGINPQVYFGHQSSFSGSSAVAGGSPSAPAPGHGASVGSVQGLNPVGFQPANLQIPALMSSLGSMMSGLANAKKSGVETSFLEQSLESRIKEAVAKGDMAETAAALQELDLAFQKANFDTRLKHAYAQYKETLANIDLLSEKVLTEQEEQKLKQATAEMNKAIQALNEEEKNKLGIVIQYLPRMLESEILANRGSAAAGFGKAEESRANAALTELDRIIRRNVQGDIEDEFYYKVENLKKQGVILDEQARCVQAAADIQRNAADHAEANFWKEFILDFLREGVDAFTSIRNSKSWERMSQSSQRRVDARLEELHLQYGDKTEITGSNVWGGTTKKTYHSSHRKYD